MIPSRAVQVLFNTTITHANDIFNHIDDDVIDADDEDNSNCPIYGTFYNNRVVRSIKATFQKGLILDTG